jgi:prephenate dehydrogenase
MGAVVHGGAIGRLAIVGDGLIGRSVQLAWRRRHPDASVIALDRGDDLTPLGSADAVVLAAPVDAIVEILPRLAALAPGAAFITDTGSTKRAIISAAAGVRRFVPGHPMAGGTSAGPAAARADLFDERPWFLLPGHAPADAREAARAFVTELGAEAVPLDDDGVEHDRLVAAISHLPQVVATALRARVGESVGADSLRYAGAGLRDTTRLAASQASVWGPILASNAPALAPLLRALADDLERASRDLEDRGATERLFARAHRFTFDP